MTSTAAVYLVHRSHDRIDWAVATLQGQEEPHVKGGRVSSTADAIIEAVRVIASLPGRVAVHTQAARLRDLLINDPHWAHLSFPSGRDLNHDLLRLAVTRTEQIQAKNKPIVEVATDGSFKGRTGGWAWVTSSGEFALAGGPAAGALHAELLAIHSALQRAPRNSCRLSIKTDSQDSIELLTAPELPTKRHTRRLEETLIAARATTRLEEITWTRGHAGDQLNELADRLSRAARHAASMNISEETLIEQATQMVRETLGVEPVLVRSATSLTFPV